MSDEEYNGVDSDIDDDASAISGESHHHHSRQVTNLSTLSEADKRAHHNALERKRRDHIKDSFCSLRDAVPSLQGEKASRAQILKKAAEYIQAMRRKNSSHQQDIDDLKRQNKILEEQIVRALEKAKKNGLSVDLNGTGLGLDSGKLKSESVSSFDGVFDSDVSNASDMELVGQMEVSAAIRINERKQIVQSATALYHQISV